MNDIKIGENIKKNREKFKLSQEILAKKLNVSSQAVSKWENEETMPSIETLLNLSKLFYTSVDELITGCSTVESATENERIINIGLKDIYYAYHRNEDFSTKLNDLVAKIMPLYNADKDYFWTYSSRIILKGTIYGILEDETTTEKNINLNRIKEVLQFSNLDIKDKQEKIKEYFQNKSTKAREYMSVYICAPTSTANSIMSLITASINILGA